MSLAYGGGISYGHWITAALADVGVNTGSLSVLVEDPETEFDFTCETHLFPRHALSFVRFWAPDQVPGKLKPGITGAVKIEEDGNEVSSGYSIDPAEAAIGDPAIVHLGSAVVTITDWIEKPDEPGEYLGFTYVLEGDPVVVDVKAARSIWRTTFETSGLWSLDGLCEPSARPLHFCQPSSIETNIPVVNDGSVPATPYVALGPASQCELFDATLETSTGVLADGPLCDLLEQPYQISPQIDPGDTALVTLSISLADTELEPGDYAADLTVTGFFTQWNLPIEDAGHGWTAASDLSLDLTVNVEPPDYGYGDCDDDCDNDECDDDDNGDCEDDCDDNDGDDDGGKKNQDKNDDAAGADLAAPAEETLPEELPGEELPAEEPPLEETQPQDPPAETQPTEEPPAEEPPSEETPPTEEPPAEEPPSEETPPTEEPPAEEPPSEETLPTEEPPAEEPPSEETLPTEEPPAEEPPGEEPPIDEPAGFDVQRASLAGLVWHEIDGDELKILGGPEDGLAGVEVVLLDENGLEVEVVETNDSGFYTFPDVEPGTYMVGFYPPDGYGFADIEEPMEPFDTPEDYEIFLAGLAKELDVEPEEIVISDLVSVDELSGPLIGLTAPVVLEDGENLGIGDAAMIETPEQDQLEETPVAQTPAEPIEIPEPPAQPAESDEGDTSVSPANPDGDAREPEPDPVEETVVPDPDQPDSVGEDPDISEPTGETVPPAQAASEEPSPDPGAEPGPPAEADSDKPPGEPTENETTP